MNKDGIECINFPAGLSKIAGDRDLITTTEFANVINVASQTIRKNYCLTGQAYGIRPIKIGSRLLWNVNQISQLIQGDL